MISPMIMMKLFFYPNFSHYGGFEHVYHIQNVHVLHYVICLKITLAILTVDDKIYVCTQ